MSKGLDALRNISVASLTIWEFEKNIEIIEKELKALEILIKKPFVSFHEIKHADTFEVLNEYLEFMYGYKNESVLTKEEYELLKEISL